jgi:hypothetical protein
MVRQVTSTRDLNQYPSYQAEGWRHRLCPARQADMQFRERRVMSKIFVNIGLSLDGYMAPEGMTMEHWGSPEYKDWGAKWGAMMGALDELEIAMAPVTFGGGRRLFENLREPLPRFRIDKLVDSPAATHLRYVRAPSSGASS